MTYPYAPAEPPLRETTDELRARIPGRVGDLDPRDRAARAAHRLLGAAAVVTVVRRVLRGRAPT